MCFNVNVFRFLLTCVFSSASCDLVAQDYFSPLMTEVSNYLFENIDSNINTSERIAYNDSQITFSNNGSKITIEYDTRSAHCEYGYNLLFRVEDWRPRHYLFFTSYESISPMSKANELLDSLVKKKPIYDFSGRFRSGIKFQYNGKDYISSGACNLSISNFSLEQLQSKELYDLSFYNRSFVQQKNNHWMLL